MATYTYEIATEFNYPNIAVYKRLRDGIQNSWRIEANPGYVMYNTEANNMEIDPNTGLEVPVTYYYRSTTCPLNWNWDNFHFVAVPEGSVEENYIFGCNIDNNHTTS